MWANQIQCHHHQQPTTGHRPLYRNEVYNIRVINRLGWFKFKNSSMINVQTEHVYAKNIFFSI